LQQIGKREVPPMLIKKKSKIFKMLVDQSMIIRDAARFFQKITENWHMLQEACAQMKELENQSDHVVHDIANEIEKTFILPMDKEDLKELSELLDDVMDNIEEVLNRLFIYRIPSSNDSLREMSRLLTRATEVLHKNIVLLEKFGMSSDEFTMNYKRLHDIENEGDKLHRKILESLVGDRSAEYNGKDPISVIKWKEIFLTIEETLDTCEKIAIIFERLKIKYI